MLALSALALSGCCEPGITEQPLKPKVAPPTVLKAGELRAAVDLDYPPYGGQEKGRQVGLDLDVAAALADRLGLKLIIVDAKAAEASRMLAERKVDVALSGLTIDDALAADLAFAGAYADSAPVLFSTKEGTATIATLGGKPVAVQKGSVAYWVLAEQYGEELLQVEPTLKDALLATSSGKVEYAAGDAIIGSYMLRDAANLRFAGQLSPSTPVGVAVSRDAAQLETTVRAALDELAAEGTLETLVRKWTGDLPELQGTADATSTP